jgi:hypothetical protein
MHGLKVFAKEKIRQKLIYLIVYQKMFILLGISSDLFDILSVSKC